MCGPKDFSNLYVSKAYPSCVHYVYTKIDEIIKSIKGNQHFLTHTSLLGIGKTALAAATIHEIILTSSDMITICIL